jgi:hypothetical protein
MKSLYYVSIILLCSSILSSCIKDTVPRVNRGGNSTSKTTTDTTTQPVVPIDPALLEGNWQVINDTSTTVPWGLWAGMPTTGKNYVGKPSDYYKFTTGGQAYTSMAGAVDTGNYTVDKNLINIIYTYFNGQETTTGIYNSQWAVSNLTAHTASLTVTFVSPETATTRVTNLRK